MGRRPSPYASRAEPHAAVSAFVDTNVLIRHLTGDPPDLAARATAFLRDADELLLADLIAAEVVYVLESYYEVPRAQVAQLMRAVVTFEPIKVIDRDLLLRSIELYEVDRLDFADAYLVACAEITGVTTIVSFDGSIDRVSTIQRLEPPRI
jgi:predicted nucleic acid-binding protein